VHLEINRTFQKMQRFEIFVSMQPIVDDIWLKETLLVVEWTNFKPKLANPRGESMVGNNV